MKKQLIDQVLLCGDDRNATTDAVYPPSVECIPSDLDYDFDYDYELTSLLAVVSLSWKVTLKLYI